MHNNNNNPLEEAVLDSSPKKPHLPPFGRFQPRHLSGAAKRLRSERKEALEEFHSTLRIRDPKQILSQFHDLYSPTLELHNLALACSLFQTTESSIQEQWKQEHDQTFSKNPLQEVLDEIDMAHIQPALQKVRTNVEHSREDKCAAGFVLQQMVNVPDKQEEYKEQLEQLSAVDDAILQQPPLNDKNEISQFLALTRKTIDLKQTLACLPGHSNYVEQVLTTRMANLEELDELHIEAASAFLPIVGDEIQQDPFNEKKFLPTHLPSPTLQGCIKALNQLGSELFGVELEEEPQCTDGWHKDVRVFHVQDNKAGDGILGSILVDPYKRPGKHPRSFCLPLRHRQVHAKPLVGMGLQIHPPVWDDEEVPITWTQAESLFHEWAHALQLVLSKSTMGGLLGAQNLPKDVEEILPKFFEHCLFEESFLESVVEFSGSNNPPTTDMKTALWEWRRQRKALQIMQTVYFGALELEVFQFDPQGEESLIGLFRRISTQFVPHDMPAQNDLSPLQRILKENAGGAKLCSYRYFWGEVIAAGLFRSFSSPLIGGGDSRVLGQRLRTDFLEPGAAFDTEKSLREFDGNPLVSLGALVEVYDL